MELKEAIARAIDDALPPRARPYNRAIVTQAALTAISEAGGRIVFDEPEIEISKADCQQCWDDEGADPFTQRMFLCPKCGNKRCPKARDHRYQCTGSNAVGQIAMLEASQ